jgi:predicted metal-binding membrane protein
MHFLLNWRDGVDGAVRMGAVHGAYCVGCCWGLMIVLFALGVMSLVWMGVVAALIFAQKVLPHGEKLSRIFAVAFVAFGIWIAASPGSVPGLTQPNHVPNDRMQMSG